MIIWVKRVCFRERFLRTIRSYNSRNRTIQYKTRLWECKMKALIPRASTVPHPTQRINTYRSLGKAYVSSFAAFRNFKLGWTPASGMKWYRRLPRALGVREDFISIRIVHIDTNHLLSRVIHSGYIDSLSLLQQRQESI
jgi:hypothetical protein